MTDHRDDPRPTTSDIAQADARRAEDVAVAEARRAAAEADEGREPLFHADEAEGLRTRWNAIQTGFVDEPRKAVEQADELVAQAMKRLAEVFAEERAELERQWDRGTQISTEDLRLALRRYRSFFARLLAI